MPEAAKSLDAVPLRLDANWRVRERSEQGAKVHPLRVISGDARSSDLDPAAFRQMVAEIIRDELRGEVGNRMTAAMRRLVRDEVAGIFAGLGRR